MSSALDAVVVGAGPNGLAAGIALAREGLSVLLLEANDTVGGSARTEELTLPGFRHDVGSAVYPLGVGSPFFSSLPLGEHGLEWVHPTVPLAHPLDEKDGVFLHRDIDKTAAGLGRDGRAYKRLVEPFVRAWPSFADHVLNSPLRPPKDPVLMGRFGLRAMRSTTGAVSAFRTRGARALFAGNAAHSGLPLEQRPAAAIGLTLMAAGHAVGWPVPRGGAGALTAALASLFRSLGGTIETGSRVDSIDELPPARARLLALTHRQVAAVAKGSIPQDYADSLAEWQYGPGAFKIDWALDAPIPWSADGVDGACTVHLGGTLEEIEDSERGPMEGRLAERPFVLLAQPSLFDPSRAPEGKHTAWAYCHVPNGWAGDATEAIENQVERFAPGFRDRILATAVHNPAQLEAWNANLVGGDVNGGSPSLSQTFGPSRWSSSPWGTPLKDLYICSASAPPGGGVHGMAGYHAAQAALKKTFGRP
jgi:phytoene dehydrogenase-like protein